MTGKCVAFVKGFPVISKFRDLNDPETGYNFRHTEVMPDQWREYGGMDGARASFKILAPI